MGGGALRLYIMMSLCEYLYLENVVEKDGWMYGGYLHTFNLSQHHAVQQIYIPGLVHNYSLFTNKCFIFVKKQRNID